METAEFTHLAAIKAALPAAADPASVAPARSPNGRSGCLIRLQQGLERSRAGAVA